MIIHDVEQKSPEWLALRKSVFTASELGPWVAATKECILTVDELKRKIADLGISISPKLLKPELEILASEHPDSLSFYDYKDAVKSARMKAIAKKIGEAYYNPDFADAYLIELKNKDQTRLDFNPAVQRGNWLEPQAREDYEKRHGFSVSTVGFITHDSGGFGCSPDGLCQSICPQGFSHGLEIKAPIPETMIRWLMANSLPSEHSSQVHVSMAASGLDRWDFYAYCPNMARLHVVVNRDAITNAYEQGLIELAKEFNLVKAELIERWNLQQLEKPSWS